jgi:hypothetical protein
MKTNLFLTRRGKTVVLSACICLSMLFLSFNSFSQGCVAIRNMGTCSGMGGDSVSHKNSWQVSVGYRGFKSHRHFRGTAYQEQRKEQKTEVINKSYSAIFALSYNASSKLSFSVLVPVSYTDRSSLYEHKSIGRYSTQSSGLGDIRVSANYWLWAPEKYTKRNISFGLGVKMPTGNYNVKDEFHTSVENTVVKPVDQSIQLGDGGWGITLETQAYAQLFKNASLYVNGFYLINPRNTNGTLTGRTDPRPDIIVSVMSVCDQYMARTGVNYKLLRHRGLYANLGARLEGIPVWDLIGGSDGFRRPGYIISGEPGLSYITNRHFVSVNVPVAIERNRTKNVADIRTKGAGGDAAFADVMLLLNYGFRF